MRLTVDLPVPATVVAVGAHPDDAEFGCGATLAKWADAGAAVHLVVCTDGSKGSWDPREDLDDLVTRRAREQQLAAAALGAKGVEFLGAPDGELRASEGIEAALCEVIRRIRPDVVVTHDPWRPHRLHPDHHWAGLLTIGAIVAARDWHFHPEQPYEPHRPDALLLFETHHADHVERVHDHVERKIEALLCHRSQWRSTMGIDERPEEQRARFAQRIRDQAQADGLRGGVRAGESFHRVDDC